MTRTEEYVAEDVGTYIYEAQNASSKHDAKQQLRFALASLSTLQPSEDREALRREIDDAWRKIDGRPLPSEEEIAEVETDYVRETGYGGA